jgi:fibronectin type 3 domain-containing protein
MVPDSTNKTYLLEIDGGSCYTVGGGQLSANTWVWVDYHSGATGSKVQQSLTKGNHTVKFIGNAPNVKVDRLLALSDLNCTPTGTGDNCNTPTDTKAPSVSLTSPTENATVSGIVNVNATASDDTGVVKVDFYDNSTLLGSDTSSPYGVTWDTAKVPGGEHLITAKAYDAAGNVGSDANTVTAQNGDTQAPSTPTEVKATALAYNKVTLTWKASTDNVGVAGYIIVRDGLTLTRVGAVTTYDDTTTLPGTQYKYKVIAIDAAENKSAASSEVSVGTPDIADSEPPSKPEGLKAATVSSSQITLSWQVSTDNTGVEGYEIYRSSNKEAAKKVATVARPGFADAALDPNTEYTYYIVAFDSNNNRSQQSDKATAKTQTKKQRTVLKGTVRDVQTSKPINQARVAVNIDTFKQLYRTGKNGTYKLRLPSGGRYNVTYKAQGYQPKTLTINAREGEVFVQDLTLTKR